MLPLAMGLSERAAVDPSGALFASAEACCGGARPAGRATEGTGRNRPPSIARPPARPGGMVPGINRPPAGVRDQINAVNRARQGRDAIAGRTGAGGDGTPDGTGAGDGADSARVARDASGRPMTPDQAVIDGVLGEAVLDNLFDRMASDTEGKSRDELLREAYDDVLRDPRGAVERVLNNPNREATPEENQAVRDAFDRQFGGTTADTGFSGRGGGTPAATSDTGGDTGAATTPAPAATPTANQGGGDGGLTADEFKDQLGDALREAFPGLDGKAPAAPTAAATETDAGPPPPANLADIAHAHAHGNDVDADRADVLRDPVGTFIDWKKDKNGTASRTTERSVQDSSSYTETIVRKDGAQVQHDVISYPGNVGKPMSETFTISWPDGMTSTMRIDSAGDRSTTFTYPDGRSTTYSQSSGSSNGTQFSRETWTDSSGSRRERTIVKTGEIYVARTTDASGNYEIQTFSTETGNEVPSSLSRNPVLGNAVVNSFTTR
ncbi:MAG: hypothetical protein H6907_20905 [Hyphomicrobiales bacterium]|nr:hypothetical protein [Hyphomicrobiales bacterium]MCP5374202.1 hypothetical protein [Hyphomicrobiales bacterium]